LRGVEFRGLHLLDQTASYQSGKKLSKQERPALDQSALVYLLGHSIS
jgi:hypothetical protein